jgi:hypothetical protein
MPEAAPFPTEGSTPRPRTRGTTRIVGSTLVVLHHLGGFRTLQFPGLLHPGTEQDSLRFQLAEPRSKPGLTRAFPGSAFTPFEAFPSLVAVPHHYGRCLLGVRQLTAPAADLTIDAVLDDSGPTDARAPAGWPPPPHRWSCSTMDRRPSGRRCCQRVFPDRTLHTAC